MIAVLYCHGNGGCRTCCVLQSTGRGVIGRHGSPAVRHVARERGHGHANVTTLPLSMEVMTALVYPSRQPSAMSGHVRVRLHLGRMLHCGSWSNLLRVFCLVCSESTLLIRVCFELLGVKITHGLS